MALPLGPNSTSQGPKSPVSLPDLSVKSQDEKLKGTVKEKGSLVSSKTEAVGESVLHNPPIQSPPKSLLSHRWEQIKSFFSSLMDSISALFSKVKGTKAHTEDMQIGVLTLKQQLDTKLERESPPKIVPEKFNYTLSAAEAKSFLKEQRIDKIFKDIDRLTLELELLPDPIEADEDVIQLLLLIADVRAVDALVESAEGDGLSAEMFLPFFERVEEKIISNKEVLRKFSEAKSPDELHLFCKEVIQDIDDMDDYEDIDAFDKSSETTSSSSLVDFDDDISSNDYRSCEDALEDLEPTVQTEPKVGEPEFPPLIKAKPPLGIPNLGNACYRLASNQALRACKPFLEILKKPLVMETLDRWPQETDASFLRRQNEARHEFFLRESIQTALLGLLDSLEKKASLKEIKEAEEILMSTLFTSNLFEFEPDNAFRQLDAAQYLELILGTVLNYQHNEQVINSGMKGSVKLERQRPAQPVAVIQIPFAKKENGLTENSLQKLVEAVYSETTQGSSDNPWDYDDKTTFTKYQERVQLTSSPKDVLVFQLKRGVHNHVGSGGADIDRTEVEIPEGGIVDFSVAHGMPKGSLKYRVESFVRLHAQTGTSGHYTSYAKENGQWYHLNDDRVTPVSDQVAQAEMAKAYFFVLQKVEPSSAA